MTQSTLPLLDAEDADAQDQPKDNRRTLLGLGGLAVIAVAAGALWLTGSADEDGLALGLPPGAPVPPTSSASASATPAAATPSPGRQATSARNPFEALQLSSAGGSVPVPTGGEAPVADVPASSAPVAATPTTAVSASATPSSGTQPSAAPHTLVLLHVGGTPDARTATFSVDGAEVVVTVGTAFGPGDVLRLLSLRQEAGEAQWSAVLQSGAGEPFDAVSGQRTTF